MYVVCCREPYVQVRYAADEVGPPPDHVQAGCDHHITYPAYCLRSQGTHDRCKYTYKCGYTLSYK